MASSLQPLRDTLQAAGVSDPDKTIKEWRALRKDRVVAATESLGELGKILRTIYVKASATAPSGSGDADLLQIKNLLVDSESRMTSSVGRVKLWTDEIRASVADSARTTEQLGNKVNALADTIGAKPSAIQYVIAASVGVFLATALLIGGALLVAQITGTQ